MAVKEKAITFKASDAYAKYERACRVEGIHSGNVHACDLLKFLDQLCKDLGGIAPVALPKDIAAVYATALKEAPNFTFAAVGLTRAAHNAWTEAATHEHALALANA